MKSDFRYGVRLAVLYGIIWFLELLGASLLNVALPDIASSFHIDPTNAEWALIGFLLAMTLGMVLSDPFRISLGSRPLFLVAQWIYILGSLFCGLSQNLSQLVAFRIVQGFGGGLAIPLGISLIMSVMPKKKWAKVGSTLNLFVLMAPAFGPILAGYIVDFLNWRWLFFVKLPISIVCLVLSYLWVRRMPNETKKPFDWWGFVFASSCLTLFLLALSEMGKPLFSSFTLVAMILGSLVLGVLFFWQERRTAHPLVQMKIFHFPLFSWGNLVQSAANMIFLGATFMIALYFQRGLHFSILKTGWMMASVTLGMVAVMPLTGKFYNRLGPLPYIIPGLLLMSFSMFALIWITPQTSPWLIASLLFLEGAGSAALQTTNFVSIFSEIPPSLKGTASSLYSLFKQISAVMGIALSTMVLSLTLSLDNLHSLASVAENVFYPSFVVLGAIPLLALFCSVPLFSGQFLIF